MEATTRLLLVRHGETAENVGGRLSTAAPGGPLSELGARQAALVAASLAARDPDAIYTSPLLRARQTADVIAARCSLVPTVVDDLAEIAVGGLDGRDDPAAFDTLNSALDAWCRADFTARIGDDGEAGEAVRERFAGVVAEIARSHPGGTVVLVSHGGLLMVGAAAVCAELPPGFAVRRFMKNTGVVELEADAGKVRCVSWEGATPHELIEQGGDR
jgi:broad specificity phosphatase PhoE